MQKHRIDGKMATLLEPVYILPKTLKVSMKEAIIHGKCLFPSSDPSIRDRVDHANICHELFVVWTCAHIYGQRRGWNRLLAIETSQKAKGFAPPDVPIDFVARLTNLRKHGGRVVGSAEAEFTLNGKELLIVKVQKFLEDKDRLPLKKLPVRKRRALVHS